MIYIFDTLYVGSHADARNKRLLDEIGIERIVVCPSDIPSYFDDKEYLRLNINPDTEVTQELIEKFLTFVGFEFFEDDTLVHIDKRTLIHCHDCQERAPSMALILICETGFPFEHAFDFIKSQVPNYEPNPKMLDSIKSIYIKGFVKE